MGHNYCIKIALQNGYSEDQGIEAESVLLCTMGPKSIHNPDLILSYLIQNYGFKWFYYVFTLFLFEI